MTKTETINRVSARLFGGFNSHYSTLKAKENNVETAAFDFVALEGDVEQKFDRLAVLDREAATLARAVAEFRDAIRQAREAIETADAE